MNTVAAFTKPGLLNEGQAAEVLSVTVSALRGWRLRGGGPRFIKIGKLVRYRPSDLEQWIESRSASHTSELAVRHEQ